MEEPILITWLNDFIFCPASIYFHNLYGDVESLSFQEKSQINGKQAHTTIDGGTYSTRASVLSGLAVYCDRYNLTGKIDLFDTKTGELTERKKKIVNIYDGYVFQLYGQYFSLTEMGYTVKRITLRSLDDNRRYPVPLPEEDPAMLAKFEAAVEALRTTDLRTFKQTNPLKCARCIYEPLCDSAADTGSEEDAEH